MGVVLVIAAIISIALVIFHFNLMVEIRRLLTRMVEIQEKGASSTALSAVPSSASGHADAAVEGRPSAAGRYSGPMKVFDIGAGETYVTSSGEVIKVVAFTRTGLAVERKDGTRYAMEPLNRSASKTTWEFGISKA